MTIVFPNTEAWDSGRDVVSFPADYGGVRIACGISWEALQDNFGGNNLAPLDCFEAHRPSIEAKAAKLILNKRFEPDGSILIRTEDGA